MRDIAVFGIGMTTSDDQGFLEIAVIELYNIKKPEREDKWAIFIFSNALTSIQ